MHGAKPRKLHCRTQEGPASASTAHPAAKRQNVNKRQRPSPGHEAFALPGKAGVPASFRHREMARLLKRGGNRHWERTELKQDAPFRHGRIKAKVSTMATRTRLVLELGLLAFIAHAAFRLYTLLASARF